METYQYQYRVLTYQYQYLAPQHINKKILQPLGINHGNNKEPQTQRNKHNLGGKGLDYSYLCH